MKESQDFRESLLAQRKFFESGITKQTAFRKQQLRLLLNAVRQYESRLLDALAVDLGKSKAEAYAGELGFVYQELKVAIRQIKRWVSNIPKPTSLIHFPTKSYVKKTPYGLCLIIGPWNYPFQLLFVPLIASMAAGNVQVLKASEFTPHTNRVIADLLAKHFDPNYISFYQGEGHLIVPQLIEAVRFDKIFFTGSTAVGRRLAIEAAKTLTPITLELGGKSPAIVDATANLKVTSKRIVWGKYFNAGQTCVSPDYVLVHKSITDQLIEQLIRAIEQFYSKKPLESADLGKIINQKHFDRLRSYLSQGKILYGAAWDAKKLKISPTIIQLDDCSQKLMQEEIFGPILPVISYETTKDIETIISKNPNPLALYVFTKDKKFEKYILDRFNFGGGCINNTLIHLNNSQLPFGGIAQSGLGAYHGEYGFLEFSHLKALSKTGTWLDTPFKYPPYSSFKFKLFKKLLR